MRGYAEEGTTTTPFDLLAMNGVDRYQLAIEALSRVDLGDQRQHRRHVGRIRGAQHRRRAGGDHQVPRTARRAPAVCARGRQRPAGAHQLGVAGTRREQAGTGGEGLHERAPMSTSAERRGDEHRLRRAAATPTSRRASTARAARRRSAAWPGAGGRRAAGARRARGRRARRRGRHRAAAACDRARARERRRLALPRRGARDRGAHGRGQRRLPPRRRAQPRRPGGAQPPRPHLRRHRARGGGRRLPQPGGAEHARRLHRGDQPRRHVPHARPATRRRWRRRSGSPRPSPTI